MGAAFKLHPKLREGCKHNDSDPWNLPQSENSQSRPDTDFTAAGGPDNYAWNVLRADSDDLMLQHASQCGVKVFDGTKVTDISFSPPSSTAGGTSNETPITGRPLSASWISDKSHTSGTLSIDYIVDASGRAGVMNRYTKSREYNQGLKNVAYWGYWQDANSYAPDTPRANSPYFEALHGRPSGSSRPYTKLISDCCHR